MTSREYHPPLCRACVEGLFAGYLHYNPYNYRYISPVQRRFLMRRIIERLREEA